MNYPIDLQIACQEPLPVTESELVSWTRLAMQVSGKSAELTLRLVDEAEITLLNSTYRKQHKPTNVLAFPASVPQGVELDYPLLGDVIICPAVLQRESLEQNKALAAHWAHIVIHGVLHLAGYNHIREEEEVIMKKMEVSLLAQCGFPDPYHEEDYNLEQRG